MIAREEEKTGSEMTGKFGKSYESRNKIVKNVKSWVNRDKCFLIIFFVFFQFSCFFCQLVKFSLNFTI